MQVQTDLAGDWQGVIEVFGVAGPLVLHIPPGEPAAATVDLPGIGCMSLPLTKVHAGDDTFSATMGETRFAFKARDGVLAGTVEGAEGSRAMDLHRDDPAVRAFRVPR